MRNGASSLPLEVVGKKTDNLYFEASPKLRDESRGKNLILAHIIKCQSVIIVSYIKL